MLVALLNSTRVLAGLAQKGPSYACPGCGQAVTLKKGTLKDKKATATGYVVHRYSPKPFEKWLHGFNFGKLWFVDVSTGMLWQGRFEKSMIEVPLSEWHVPGGGTESAGGYSRVSKRWRKLSLTGPFGLGQLKISRALRKQGSMGSHVYPQGQRVTFAPR